MNKTLLLVGTTLTVAYVTFIGYFLVRSGLAVSPKPAELPLNEIGDFASGAVGPLALVWLIIGQFQNAIDIRSTKESLDMQKEELTLLVAANVAQVMAVKDGTEKTSKHAEKQNELQTASFSGQLLLPIFLQTREKCSDSLKLVASNWRRALAQSTGTDAPAALARLKGLAASPDGELEAERQLQAVSSLLKAEFAAARLCDRNHQWPSSSAEDAFRKLDTARRTISLIAQQVHQIANAGLVSDIKLLKVTAFADFVATYKYCVFPLDSAVQNERDPLPYQPGQTLVDIYTRKELIDAIY